MPATLPKPSPQSPGISCSAVGAQGPEETRPSGGRAAGFDRHAWEIIEIFDDGGDDKETAADVDGNLLQEAGAMRNNTEGPSTIKNPRIYAGN